MKLEAHAKINLGLDVKRRRPDGYHEVDMVMQSLALCDNVTMERTETEGISLSTDSSALPTDEKNLAYKAAKLIIDRYGLTGGVTITIEKNIPIAAGLAGGSTDCAAVLKGMNELFSLEISDEELRALGKSLGADVPYCLLGGTARSEGIGEILTPLPEMKPFPTLLVKPRESVSTKETYEGLKLTKEIVHPDIDGLIRAMETGELTEIARFSANLLETVTMERLPVIGEIKDALKRLGAAVILMSGSGPTVFSLFNSMEQAKEAEQGMLCTNLGDQVCLTTLS